MRDAGSPLWARALVLLWLPTAVGCAFAQPASSPATPSEPHEALAFFEGSWTTSDSKPEDDFRETCSWLPGGRRHMICRSRWKAPSGYREGLSIFSWDVDAGEYRYHGFRSGGSVATQKGERLPNGWVFTSDRGAGAERVQSRVTIARTGEGRFSFLSESAKGNSPWQAGARFEYLRLGP